LNNLSNLFRYRGGRENSVTDVIIELIDLHKYYGKLHALRGLNLTVTPGEVFGFLGPNGAGKTTTIRCMLDLIRPNRGTIKIYGHQPAARAAAGQSQTGLPAG
jgi:ABC-2 type transport system ATP-binding protein